MVFLPPNVAPLARITVGRNGRIILGSFLEYRLRLTSDSKFDLDYSPEFLTVYFHPNGARKVSVFSTRDNGTPRLALYVGTKTLAIGRYRWLVSGASARGALRILKLRDDFDAN